MECRISWANTNVILKKTVAAIVSSESFESLNFVRFNRYIFVGCVLVKFSFFLPQQKHTDTQTN